MRKRICPSAAAMLKLRAGIDHALGEHSKLSNIAALEGVGVTTSVYLPACP
jgi:hypothetical protein